MRRTLALVLILMMLLISTAFASPDWTTGDMLLVSNCDEWISLRADPSTDAEQLCKLPLGTEVYFLSNVDDRFSHVYCDGQYGYVLSDYLVYDGTTVRYVTGCSEWISLREAASADSAQLARVPLRSMVYATNDEDSAFSWVDWSPIGDLTTSCTCNTPHCAALHGQGVRHGFALDEYLSVTPFQPGDTLTIFNYEESVSLREAPSAQSGSLAQLHGDDTVEVLDASGENGFVKVRCGDLTGYVLSGYLCF